jgi:hypothetical protein
MAKISKIIPEQNFETVRNRLANIFIEEIENQANYTGDTDLAISVGIEQKIPLDKSELPMMNIGIAQGNFNNKSVSDSTGVFAYNFDFFCDKENTDDLKGDTSAALWASKIAGKAIAILSNDVYRTLGYDQKVGGIERVQVSSMTIGDVNSSDARHSVMSRVVVTVTFNQNTPLLDANLLEGFDTSVKMGESNAGYKYRIDV